MFLTKFFKATPGWGTSDLDSVINEWLGHQKIDLVDIKYNSHVETKTGYYGDTKEIIVYTALLVYK